MQNNEFGSVPQNIRKIKQIKGLNVRIKTIKPLGKNVGINLLDFGIRGWFLVYETKSTTTQRKINETSSKLETCF